MPQVVESVLCLPFGGGQKKPGVDLGARDILEYINLQREIEHLVIEPNLDIKDNLRFNEDYHHKVYDIKRKISKNLKNVCKKLKIRLTITRNGKRYRKSLKLLEKVNKPSLSFIPNQPLDCDI